MCFDKKKTKLGISKEPIFINQIANYFLEIVIDSSVAEPEPTLFVGGAGFFCWSKPRWLRLHLLGKQKSGGSATLIGSNCFSIIDRS